VCHNDNLHRNRKACVGTIKETNEENLSTYYFSPVFEDLFSKYMTNTKKSCVHYSNYVFYPGFIYLNMLSKQHKLFDEM